MKRYRERICCPSAVPTIPIRKAAVSAPRCLAITELFLPFAQQRAMTQVQALICERQGRRAFERAASARRRETATASLTDDHTVAAASAALMLYTSAV
jgi:hypothetical protein